MSKLKINFFILSLNLYLFFRFKPHFEIVSTHTLNKQIIATILTQSKNETTQKKNQKTPTEEQSTGAKRKSPFFRSGA